jgi:hypothetical protein
MDDQVALLRRWICEGQSQQWFHTRDSIYVTSEFGVRTGLYFDRSRFDRNSFGIYAFIYPTMALGSVDLGNSERQEILLPVEHPESWLRAPKQVDLKERLVNFVLKRRTVHSFYIEVKSAHWTFEFWDSYYLSLLYCWTENYTMSKFVVKKANWLLARMDDRSGDLVEIHRDLSALVQENGPNSRRILLDRATLELHRETQKVKRVHS